MIMLSVIMGTVGVVTAVLTVFISSRLGTH